MRVLVVDDNHINQQVAASLLGNMGHRADVVGSGKEALEAFNLMDYEMILMDLQMPEMDGFVACNRIRSLALAKNRSIPIIAITAHAMKGDREKCLELGFDGYISKPINPKDLRAAVDATSSGNKKTLLAASEESPSYAHGSLDLAKALAQLEGDHQLLAEISQIFIETYPQLLEQIHNALAASNQQQLIAAAHTLASSAGQIGAMKGHAMAKKLEEMGRRHELSLAPSAAAELDAEIRLVASVISDHAGPYFSLPQTEP